MTTYGLTSYGFTPKTFGIIRQEVEDYEKLHINAGLDVSDDSPLGQIQIPIFLQIAKLWEEQQALYASRDPDIAVDWSLDVLAALSGTQRSAWSKTVVTAQVEMDPNKALPAGSIANLTGRPNTQFVSLVEVPADPSGGTFDVDFEAAEAGATTVAIGQLNEITVAVDGWVSVTNAAAGETGTEPEDNDEFREKRERELSLAGSTNLDAIISEVSAVDGVTAVFGEENDSPVVVNGIVPHGIHLVIRGGANADIAAALWTARGCGTGMTGDVSEEVSDSSGVSHTMKWDTTTDRNFYCTLTIQVILADGWVVADDASRIALKAAIAAYVNDTGIGEDVIYDKVKAAAITQPGVYKIVSCYTAFSAVPSGTADLTVAQYEKAVSAVSNISVSYSVVTP